MDPASLYACRVCPDRWLDELEPAINRRSVRHDLDMDVLAALVDVHGAAGDRGLLQLRQHGDAENVGNFLVLFDLVTLVLQLSLHVFSLSG